MFNSNIICLLVMISFHSLLIFLFTKALRGWQLNYIAEKYSSRIYIVIPPIATSRQKNEAFDEGQSIFLLYYLSIRGR